MNATQKTTGSVVSKPGFLVRHALDVMLVSLSAMVMTAGYFRPEITFYMAGA